MSPWAQVHPAYSLLKQEVYTRIDVILITLVLKQAPQGPPRSPQEHGKMMQDQLGRPISSKSRESRLQAAVQRQAISTTYACVCQPFSAICGQTPAQLTDTELRSQFGWGGLAGVALAPALHTTGRRDAASVFLTRARDLVSEQHGHPIGQHPQSSD